MSADVVLVSLGATTGLRAADEELAAALRRAGASVEVVEVRAPREVRTFALTDLGWALAARRAARDAPDARAVLYSSITAALLWPRPGVIRFDSLARENRPGRHGFWQRPAERRRLRQASLLVPWSEAALWAAPAGRADAVVVPVPVEPSGPADGERDIAAITYGAHPEKKGLDRVLAAWARLARPGEELVVAGVDERRALKGGSAPGGVRFMGRLGTAEYRALLRRARVFVTAPRREDHGIAQLEALADGCALVTTEAPGPYVALPLARELDPRLVGDDLATSLRTALDDPLPDYATRAAAALAPLSRAKVDAIVADELLPRLLNVS